jgi:hypothetical protein
VLAAFFAPAQNDEFHKSSDSFFDMGLDVGGNEGFYQRIDYSGLPGWTAGLHLQFNLGEHSSFVVKFHDQLEQYRAFEIYHVQQNTFRVPLLSRVRIGKEKRFNIDMGFAPNIIYFQKHNWMNQTWTSNEIILQTDLVLGMGWRIPLSQYCDMRIETNASSPFPIGQVYWEQFRNSKQFHFGLLTGFSFKFGAGKYELPNPISE